MRELVHVVDENDEVIGEKYRDELTSEDLRRHITVNLFNELWEMLIQQRSYSKDSNPWLRTFSVSGMVWTESYEEAAIRECQEELWVALDIPDLEFVAYEEANESRPRFRKEFKKSNFPSDFKFTLQESEVEAVRWINIFDLLSWIETRPQDFPSGFKRRILERHWK